MKSVIIIMCSLIVLSTGLLACNAGENPVPPTSQPFTISGNYYELSGNSRGYTPKGTYNFNLAIRNDTDEEWKSNCYIFLIDKNGPLMDISDIEFDLLHNGDQESTVVEMTLPADIKPGAYGLALSFPDKGCSVVTIYVGENIPAESIFPWPDISSYRQKPVTSIWEELTIDDFTKQPHYSWVATTNVGDNIVVTLESNPTTGFKWPDIAQIQDQDILKQINHKFVNSEQTGVVGAASKEIWTFKALKKGATTLTMEYRRPWESTVESEWTFIATITVK